MNSKQKQILNPLHLMLAQTAVLTDCIPKTCDAIFVHCVPIQDDSLKNKHLSLITRAYKKGLIKTIVLNPLTAVICHKNNIEDVGYKKLRDNLIANGISENDIKIIPASLHTAMESMEFLKMAKVQNWKNIIISSQPHHQLRCFLQIISIMKEINFYPKVYNLTHYEIPWNQIYHRPILNEELFVGNFYDHIESEYKRIIKYSDLQKKEFHFKKHATIDEMLTYLNSREN